MASHAFSASSFWSSASNSQELLSRGQEILRSEADAIVALSDGLDESFCHAVEMILDCTGSVIATGMGKAGIIAQKLAASLSSTGTPSHFLHPAEAVHGDLGCVRSNDVVVVFSYSGETEEVTRLLPLLGKLKTIAITARQLSTLGRSATLTLELGAHREACSLGLAPTTTTTAMLALADAMTLVVAEQRGLTREQFAQFHPAGSLGRQLTRVHEIMRPLAECRVASHRQTLREVIIQVSRPGRRTGAVMLVDEAQQLVGVFTDSDLARLLERSEESKLDQCVAEVMTRVFTTTTASCMLPEALQLMAQRKISELPVIDTAHRPLGIIDLTDLVSVATEDSSPTKPNAPLDARGKEAATGLRILRPEQ
jgi:arabinose-5-phosphate isomerase